MTAPPRQTRRVTDISERLPVRPAPQPGEWLGSWLSRLAHANHVPARSVIAEFEVDPQTGDVPERGWRRMSARTGLGEERLRQMATPRHTLRRIGHPGSAAPPVLGVRYAQVCPHCLARDEVPHIRRDWLRTAHAACPEHGGPLRELCPGCEAPILGGTLDRPQGWRRCWHCQADLAVPLEGVTLERLPDLDRPRALLGARLGEVPDQDTWDDLVFALWTMLRVCRVDELMGPGLIRIRRPPKLSSGLHSLEARFAAQRLTASLLRAEGDDGFITLRMRLERTSLLLLGAILPLDVTSRRRWLYLGWMLTRLTQDSPSELLVSWPPLVHHLARRLEGQAEPLPQPPIPARLTDEQWEEISGLLPVPADALTGRPGRQMPPREAFEGLLQRALTREPWGREPTLRRTAEAWADSGRLSLALERLHTHLVAGTGRNFWRAALGGEPGWQRDTARLLLSDGVVELARQVNPSLHRELLRQVVRAGTNGSG